MKKSSFVALLMGTVSGVLFALGMCMALLPEWNAFWEGVIFGGVGLVLSVITLLVWCKMENKKMPKMNGKNVFRIIYAVVAVLILGAGMCLCLVCQQYPAHLRRAFLRLQNHRYEQDHGLQPNPPNGSGADFASE